MKVLVDLCIVPLGVGVSLSSYIAACQKVLTGAGLETALRLAGGFRVLGDDGEIEFPVIEHFSPKAAIYERTNVLDEHTEFVFRDRVGGLLRVNSNCQPVRDSRHGLRGCGWSRKAKP